MSNALHLGDCLEVLQSLKGESIDALVTDPPAGIGFMGRTWDTFGRSNPNAEADRTAAYDRYGKGALLYGFSGASRTPGDRQRFIAFLTTVAEECYRVLKPGAHGLVWAIPRTSHWTGMALEDAGFEIRDSVTHLFGQGFPKSLDVSKAIDKMAGAEREVMGPNPWAGRESRHDLGRINDDSWSPTGEVRNVTAPATEAAKQWQGWGTALKPACEVWWLIRKPLAAPNVASQVLATGTGALNIDGSRVGSDAGWSYPNGRGGKGWGDQESLARNLDKPLVATAGRWPANVVLTCCGEEPHAEGCAVAELDRQSGERPGMGIGRVLRRGATTGVGMGYGSSSPQDSDFEGYGDKGGASRFFYTAKASTAERSAGLHKPGDRNAHPTVKPTDLMRWLCRLITPPGGLILDPFMGSGSTGVAARLEGFGFVGIEKDPESFATAEKRLGWAVHEPGLFAEA